MRLVLGHKHTNMRLIFRHDATLCSVPVACLEKTWSGHGDLFGYKIFSQFLNILGNLGVTYCREKHSQEDRM